MTKVTSAKEKREKERSSCPHCQESLCLRGKLGHFTKLEPPTPLEHSLCFRKKAKVFMLKTFLNSSA